MKFLLVAVVLSSVIKVLSCTVISNVNSMFEVFSPKSMVRFFEFNDKGWNISTGCIRDMYSYLDGLQKDLKWAYKLLDASSAYSGGFNYGQNYRPANPEHCKDLNREIIQKMNLGFYNESSLPFYVQVVTVKYSVTLDIGDEIEMREIYQVNCLPSSCNYEDLSQIMSYYTNIQDNDILKDAELTDIRILDERFKIYKDYNFYIILVISSIFITLTLMISIYGCILKYTGSNARNDSNIVNNNIINESLQKNRQIVKCLTPPNTLESKRSVSMNPKYAKIVPSTSIPPPPPLPKGLNHQNIKISSNKMTNVKMDAYADSLTISNINSNNHVNLVKVQKIKSDKTGNKAGTISLEIISANCYNAFALQKKQTLRRIGERNRANEFRDTLLKFSLQQQFKNLLSDCLDSDKVYNCIDEIRALHGIRVLCLFWIILVHTATFLSYVTLNKKYIENVENKWFLLFIFRNGSYSIDSYFFISGILLCHSFYSSTRDLGIHKVCGIFDQFLHYIALNLFKILRLILPFVVILHIHRLAMKYYNDHSINYGVLPSNDHFTCDNMYKNILFVDNFSPYTDRCMLWSWYISLEVQFFVIASLILKLHRKFPRYAIVIFLSFFISSLFTTTIIKMNRQLNNVSNFTIEEKLMHFNGVYDQPLVRLGPYIFGIFFGCFLCRNNKKISFSFSFKVCGWVIWLILCALLMAGPFYVNNHVTNPLWKSGFLTVSHSLWALILMWICFASAAGFGGVFDKLFSCKIFYLLSKISTCVLLLHPLVTRILILSSNNAIFISVQMILVMFIGFAVISIVIGLIFYLIFEAPVVVLLNIIYEKSMKT